MSCRRFDELHMLSTDHPLDPTEQAEFDAHLAQCPPCVARMKDYVVTSQLLHGLRAIEAQEDEVLPPLAPSLVERILTARRDVLRGSQRRSETA
jgi:anti-sigma factor RsiW